jgi:hypothetical protein
MPALVQASKASGDLGGAPAAAAAPWHVCCDATACGCERAEPAFRRCGRRCTAINCCSILSVRSVVRNGLSDDRGANRQTRCGQRAAPETANARECRHCHDYDNMVLASQSQAAQLLRAIAAPGSTVRTSTIPSPDPQSRQREQGNTV